MVHKQWGRVQFSEWTTNPVPLVHTMDHKPRPLGSGSGLAEDLQKFAKDLGYLK